MIFSVFLVSRHLPRIHACIRRLLHPASHPHLDLICLPFLALRSCSVD